MIRNDYDYLLKFILIGDSSTLSEIIGVGKSCILTRLLEGKFKSQHEPTLGVQFGTKAMKIKEKDIKIQIWDTAGQESFRSITRAYYKGSIAAILAFDITSQRSFQSLSHWLYELKNHSHHKIHIILIGNKKDLEKNRQVDKEAGFAFAEKNGFVKYIETSALSGENIDVPFIQLAQLILSQIQNGTINVNNDSTNGIKVGKKLKSLIPKSILELKTSEKKEVQSKCDC